MLRLRITGANLKFDKADAAQGVFLTRNGSAETRLERYLEVTDGTVSILMPANLTGPLNLTIRVKYGTDLLQTIYATPVLAEA